MTTISYRNEWARQLEEHRKEFQTVLNEMGPEDDWEDNMILEVLVEEDLLDGLKVLLGGDSELATPFFERGKSFAIRAIEESKCTSEVAIDGFPKNRAHILLTRAYSQALLGQGEDKALLLQAADDFAAWCVRFGGKVWSDPVQGDYLSAVRLCLVTGESERARELLTVRKPFKRLAVEHGLWKRVAASGTTRPIDDPPLLADLTEFFDEVRSPRYKPAVLIDFQILRLELSAIRYKYFLAPDGRIVWDDVVEEIRR